MKKDTPPAPDTPKQGHPLWETIVLGASFLFLWVWFLAHRGATATPGGKLGIGWTLLQIVAVAALVFVMVRRMARLRKALHEGSRLPSQFPFMPGGSHPDARRNGAPRNGAPRNGAAHNGASHNGTSHNGVSRNGTSHNGSHTKGKRNGGKQN